MFPKNSIIIPTLNQAKFIEETIHSVLDQNYPNLELIVLDDASTDGTLEILQKYDDSLTWISEPDKGQVDAINKGLRMVTGDVVGYLNSDDLYTATTLMTVSKYFSDHPEAKIETGKCINIDQNGVETRSLIKFYKNFWLTFGIDKCLMVLDYVSQPSTFWRTELIHSIGFFDGQFHNAMYSDYWLRVTKQHMLKFINQYYLNFAYTLHRLQALILKHNTMANFKLHLVMPPCCS